MILNILTWEQIRRFVVWILCSIAAAVSPTGGFVTALVLTWAFNVWCGMRADGVTNIRCKNFSWKKFAHALCELMLFLIIIELIAVVTYTCGDGEEGLWACKTINYVFAWCYCENGLKNLCKANPHTKALWLIYLFMRFEITKIIHIDNLMEMYEEHLEKMKGKEGRNDNKGAIDSDNAEH